MPRRLSDQRTYEHCNHETDREARRVDVYRLKLDYGLSAQEIATRLKISYATVLDDLKRTHAIFRDAGAYDSIDRLNHFINQMDMVIKRAAERMDRETGMEDEYQEQVEQITQAIEEGGDNLKVSFPMPPRSSHAMLLKEMRMAAESQAKAFGILRENYKVTLELMDTDALVKLAQSKGIDVDMILNTPAIPLSLPEAGQQAAEEGEFQVIEGEKLPTPQPS